MDGSSVVKNGRLGWTNWTIRRVEKAVLILVKDVGENSVCSITERRDNGDNYVTEIVCWRICMKSYVGIFTDI